MSSQTLRRGAEALSSLTILFALAALPLEGCSCAAGAPNQDGGTDATQEEDTSVAEAGPDVQTPDTCGNGLADELETCDPNLQNVSDPRLRCDCDDGNACTLDRCKAGTSAEACTCECENILQHAMYGVGNCDDGDTCTNDVVACADENDPRTPQDCAGSCEIECSHTEQPWCQDICGNGVINPGETCEVFVDGVSLPNTPACTCEDNNPCTIDIAVSGSPATCNLVCYHQPRGASDYGFTTCNDGKSCTQDVIINGSPSTCDVVCQHNPVAGWEIAACNDNNACTADTVTSSDVNNCNVVCNHTTYTGYPYQSWGCDDGIPCTTDVQGLYNPSTCQYACTHTGMSGYELTHCDDGDACTTDSIIAGAPMTCNVTCGHHDTRTDADAPDTDATFDDTNCDGIDGDAATLVFVSPDGNDSSGNGTRTSPFATIARGIDFAQANGRAHVAVSAGTYPQRIVMRNGVSIHGGYARNGNGANSWTRNAANITTIAVPQTTIVDGRVEAVFAQNIGSRTQINRFVISAGSPSTAPTGSGTSVYGIRVMNSTAGVGGGLELHYVSASAGRAAAGGGGGTGNQGQGGNTGGNAPGRSPGGGAVQQCGTGSDVAYTRGGAGGWGGYDDGGAACWGAHDGEAGNPPPGHSGCGVGYAGDAASGCGTDGSHAGGAGSSSCSDAGGTGSAASGITTRGTVVAGAWVPTNGQANAGRGGHGVGGSGGGGGGSGNCDTICTGPDGGGGGGGGSGGCGGYPGSAGSGGGGSFGLFVVDSTILTANATFQSSNGGNGGVGGAGGGGGGGGAPGNPAGGSNPNGSWAINARGSSAGGIGGWGRNGGQAGGAGGGAGGPSVAQFVCRSTVSGITLDSGMSGSAGGAGGGGAPNGPAGPAGTASDLTSVNTANCAL